VAKSLSKTRMAESWGCCVGCDTSCRDIFVCKICTQASGSHARNRYLENKLFHCRLSGISNSHPKYKKKKNSEETGKEQPKEGWVLTNKIELTPDHTREPLSFLTAEKETLKQIATDEDRDARETLGKVYSLIAEHGRKIREGGKEVGTIVEPHKKKIITTAIQKGKYFTIPQAAEACNKTSRQIRAWIRRGKLEAVELPGLGMIIEVGKLNQFVNENEIMY